MVRECGDCMVLVGGLNSKNVVVVVVVIEFWVVDVASGVESLLGYKDLVQILVFVEVFCYLDRV